MADINIQMKNKIGETWNKLFPKTKIGLVEGLSDTLTDVDTRLNAAATKVETDAKIAVVNEQLAETAENVDNLATTTETALATKTTKGEISVLDIDKNRGKFDETYMTEAFLEQITGGAPVNAVPPDNGVTKDKYAVDSVAFQSLNTAIANKTVLSDVDSVHLAYHSTQI